MTLNSISNKNADLFILSVLIISFSIGTITHFIDILRLDFFGYSKIAGVTPWLNVFWTSLLFLDPLIIFLLIFYKNIGVILSFIILLLDVIVNYYHMKYNLNLTVTEIPSFSLQASCLFFSAATLPKMIVDDKGKKRFEIFSLKLFSKIPIVVLGVGLLIHLRGLFAIFSGNMSLWEIWVHFFMTIFNGFLVYLLSNNTKIGFWLGVIAFGIFGFIQICYATGAFLSKGIPFNLGMGIYLSVCLITISSLLANKSKMNKHIGIYDF